MRSLPSKFLAVTLAVALPVVFCRRAPVPDQPAAAPGIELAPAPDAVLLRLAAKQLLAREVANGRRSLIAAAALFRELNRMSPEPAEPAISGPYTWSLRAPARSDEERLCRQVLEWVVNLLHREQPDRADAAAARLEAELHDELRTRGVIRFPDPSSLESVEDLLKRAEASLPEQERKDIRSRRGAD
jgi:hypothetical protein